MSTVRWEIRATKDLARIDPKAARQIIAAVEIYAAERRGKIKPLKGRFAGQSRLAVREWRVLYYWSGDELCVCRVSNRKDAYR